VIFRKGPHHRSLFVTGDLAIPRLKTDNRPPAYPAIVRNLPRPSPHSGRLLADTWPHAAFAGGSGTWTRSRLHALAYKVANFMRIPSLPKQVEYWSLTTIREKLVKVGAKVFAHGRYVTFQMAEVAVPPDLFRRILNLIDGLRRPSLAAG
jgi:hypothetical protein